MGDKRDAYVEKLKVKLDKWNKEIDQLSAKADRGAEEVRAEYKEKIVELKLRRLALEEKIGGLQKAGEAAWKDLKEGVDAARLALGKSMKAARARFN